MFKFIQVIIILSIGAMIGYAAGEVFYQYNEEPAIRREIEIKDKIIDSLKVHHHFFKENVKNGWVKPDDLK